MASDREAARRLLLEELPAKPLGSGRVHPCYVLMSAVLDEAVRSRLVPGDSYRQGWSREVTVLLAPLSLPGRPDAAAGPDPYDER